MKEEEKKILGNERRELIVKWLQQSSTPIPGRELAERTNVSRQVIVQDVSLLKAGNKPIIATNRGYLYVQKDTDDNLYRRVIVCQHEQDGAKKELNIIVDNGATVVDVSVEHAIYGELTGSLMISSRYDVNEFIKRVEKTSATLLSRLTGGIHLHTIEADSVDKLDAVCDALKRANILVIDDE